MNGDETHMEGDLLGASLIAVLSLIEICALAIDIRSASLL